MIIDKFLVAGALAALVASAGCRAPDPYDYPGYDELRRSAPQPLTARVLVVQKPQLGEEASGGGFTPTLLRADKKADIESKIANSLKEHQAFVATLPSNESKGTGDVEVVVTIVGPPKYSKEGSLNWGINSLLWLLAGLPGWIFNDRTFETGIDVAYEVRRLRPLGAADTAMETPVIFRGKVDFSDSRSLNFFRRASWTEFGLQVLYPPTFMNSNKGKADLSIYDNFISRMQRTIGQRMKADLERGQLDSSVNFPYLH